MIRVKTAGEIMIPLEDYPCVSLQATLRQIIGTMEKWQLVCNGRKSLPRVVLVFDEAKELLGIVRRRD